MRCYEMAFGVSTSSGDVYLQNNTQQRYKEKLPKAANELRENPQRGCVSEAMCRFLRGGKQGLLTSATHTVKAKELIIPHLDFFELGRVWKFYIFF